MKKRGLFALPQGFLQLVEKDMQVKRVSDAMTYRQCNLQVSLEIFGFLDFF
jgi:hypothetical protein